MRTASQVVTVRGCSVFVSILCSHTIRPRLSIFSISLRFQSYAVIQTATTQIPPSCPRTIISILCSHTDCDVYGVAVASKVITFQSYAVIQTALATQRRKNYGFNLMQSYTTDNIYRLIAYILATLWLYLPPQFISIFCGPPDRLAFIGQLHIRPPWLHQRFTFFFNSNPLVCVRIVFQNVLGNHFPVLDVL